MDDFALPNGGDAAAEFSYPSTASATASDDDGTRLRKQVDFISEELRKSTAQISSLTASLDSTTTEKASMALRIEVLEADLKSLEAVAHRASALEGDVTHLQEELDAASASAEEAISELGRAKSDLEEALRQKSAVEAASAELERRVALMVTEKAEADAKASDRELLVQELNALLKEEREKHAQAVEALTVMANRFEVDSLEKDSSVYDAQRAAENAAAELQALKDSLYLDANVRDSVVGDSGSCCRLKGNPWIVAATSAGAMATVAMVYLHFSRKR